MSQHTKQQVLSAFHFRSAIRRYDPNKKVSEEDFHYILELGRLSPSSVGFRTVAFSGSTRLSVT